MVEPTVNVAPTQSPVTQTPGIPPVNANPTSQTPPPNPATQPTQDTDPIKDKSWAAVLTRERLLTEREKKVKELEKHLPSQDVLEKAKRFDEMERMRKEDPLGFAKSVIPYDQYTDMIVKDEPNAPIRLVKDVEKKVEGTREELEKFRQEISQKEAEQINKQAIQFLYSELDKTKEKYPITYWATQKDPSIMDAIDHYVLQNPRYAANGDVMPMPVTEAFEHFEKLHDEYSKSLYDFYGTIIEKKKAQTQPQATPGNQATQQAKPSGISLTNADASQPVTNSPGKPLSRKELLERSVKMHSWWKET